MRKTGILFLNWASQLRSEGVERKGTYSTVTKNDNITACKSFSFNTYDTYWHKNTTLCHLFTVIFLICVEMIGFTFGIVDAIHITKIDGSLKRKPQGKRKRVSRETGGGIEQAGAV